MPKNIPYPNDNPKQLIGSKLTALADNLIVTHRKRPGETILVIVLTFLAFGILGATYLRHTQIHDEYRRTIGKAFDQEPSFLFAFKDISNYKMAQKVEQRLHAAADKLALVLSEPESYQFLDQCKSQNSDTTQAGGKQANNDNTPDTDNSFSRDQFPNSKILVRPRIFPAQGIHNGGLDFPALKIDAVMRVHPFFILVSGVDTTKTSADSQVSTWASVAPQDTTSPGRVPKEISLEDCFQKAASVVVEAFGSFSTLNDKFRSVPTDELTWTGSTIRRQNDFEDAVAGFVYCAVFRPSAIESLTVPIGNWYTNLAADLGDTNLARVRPGVAFPTRESVFQEPPDFEFLSYPAAYLPPEYHPAYRPWFEKAFVRKEVVWSPIYSDPGTGESLISVSVPILSADNTVLGVFGVDLKAHDLSHYVEDGSPHIANFTVSLLASFILLGIIYASRKWQRLLALLIAVASFVLLYFANSILFLFSEPTVIGDRLKSSVEIFFSLLNSALFVLAGFYLLNEEQRRSGLSYRYFERITIFLEGKPATSHFFMATASSIVVWLLTLALSNAFGPPNVNDNSIQRVLWVDAIIGFLSISYFGFRLAMWGRHFLRRRRTSIIGILVAFGCYGVIQLSYPVMQNHPAMYLVLFWGKVIVLSIIILVTFSNAQSYNFIRRQMGAVMKKVYSRPLAKDFFVIIGKTSIQNDYLLSMSEVAAIEMGYLSHKPEDDGPEDCCKSLFGSEDFYEPEKPKGLREHIHPQDFSLLMASLEACSGGDRGEKRLRNRTLRFRSLQGGDFCVRFQVIALWKDKHIGNPPLSESYLVGIGNVIGKDE